MKELRRFGTAVIVSLLVSVTGACASPPGGVGGVVGLGRYAGQIWTSPVIYQYDGTAGEQLNIAMGVQTPLSKLGGSLRISAPDGSGVLPVRSEGCQPTDVSCILSVVLPSAGRYTIVLPTNPSPTSATNFILQLTHDEDHGVLPFGVRLAYPEFGQTLIYHFDGTSGDIINVNNALVIDPDGVAVPVTPPGSLHGHVTLPVTGTYTVLIRWYRAILSRDLVGGPIGLGSTVTPSLFGSTISYSYAGTAGEVLGIGTDDGVDTAVLDPDGNPVPGILGGSGRLTLPVDGTYTVVVGIGSDYDPRVVTVWLTHDLDGGTIAAGGVTTPSLVQGQSVSYQYLGAAGEVLRIHTSWDWYGPSPTPRVFAPDGTELSASHFNDGLDWQAFGLAVTGTYRILVSPTHAATATMVLWSII